MSQGTTDKRPDATLAHRGIFTRLANLCDESNPYGSISPPLVQTSTFAFPSAEVGAARFAGKDPGFVYTRLGSPTVAQFERVMAELEGGEAAVAFASGMGAISATLLHTLAAGEHVLCSKGVYGSTFGLLQFMQERLEIAHSFAPLANPDEVRAALRPNTRAVYIETPINPTLALVDIEMVADVAHERGIPVIVDNTFLTPYLQRPLTRGADVAIHSATKYIGGHGDVIAGVAISSGERMGAIRTGTLKDIGSVLSPFDAWLLLRGVRTLAVRMDRHVANAHKVAEFLNGHAQVETVYFPGLATGDQARIRDRQMAAAGAMISFEVRGGYEAGVRMLDALRLIKLAVSLGDIQTLIQHPASMTHSMVPREDRLHMGLSDGLIRLSVGLEDADDLIEDLRAGLDCIGRA
ncbi:MAG: PLP-dependent transferase [Firmicutes bacterium]|nr:PLP-dependent transferase [Bacillota bacterium]